MAYLSNAAGWLSGLRHAAVSEPVSYLPIGELTPWTIRGTPCGIGSERLDDGPASAAGGLKDWLFRYEDFSTLPAPGDQITDAAGDVWEVVERPGEPVWWYADEYHQDIRVHTILN